MQYRYHVEDAPGTHTGPNPSIESHHETLEAALDAACKNDRLTAVDTETGERWTIPQQDHPQYGSGRYGRGISRDEARELGWPL